MINYVLKFTFLMAVQFKLDINYSTIHGFIFRQTVFPANALINSRERLDDNGQHRAMPSVATNGYHYYINDIRMEHGHGMGHI